MLTDGRVTLRAMEPADVEPMYRWENDAALWSLGDTTMPFSRAALRRFVDSAGGDFFAERQMRLVVEVGGRAVGCVDLFDYHPIERRAAVGVLIYDERGCGYGTIALKLLSRYAFERLRVEHLYAYVPLSNVASQRMCTAAGFSSSAVIPRWNCGKDAALYQLFY